MKTIIRILAVAPIMLASTTALAQSGFYVGVVGGGSFVGEQDLDSDLEVIGIDLDGDTEVEYDPAFRLGGFLGYQLDTNVRLQFDVGYMSGEGENRFEAGNAEIDSDQDIEILSGTAGLYLDLWPIGAIVPYVGAGLGVARIEVTNDDIEDSDQTVLTGFAEAGVPIDLNEYLVLVPSAHFAWYDTEEKTAEVVDGITNIDAVTIGENLYETQLMIGVRYSF